MTLLLSFLIKRKVIYQTLRAKNHCRFVFLKIRFEDVLSAKACLATDTLSEKRFFGKRSEFLQRDQTYLIAFHFE